MSLAPTPPRRYWRQHPLLPPVIAGLIGLLIWTLVATRSFVVPSPWATVQALFDSLGDAEYRGHLYSTAIKSAVAAVIGIVLGLLLGLALGQSRRLRNIFEPTVVSMNAVPKIILYPIIVSVLSLGARSQIALGALFSFFPVLINVAAGVRAIPPVYLRLGRSLQLSAWQRISQVTIPAIRRPLITSARLAISLAAVGVILAEIFATKKGLGRVIMRTYSDGRYPEMMATIVVLMTASFLITLVMWRLERRAR